ncbi:MAG: addiction module protein [Proteobacteria bacterium]|nr:addiction module protein [Pseudomonadota bacterium]
MNTQLLSEAQKLSLDDRIELVEAIWDSMLPEVQTIPLPDSHRTLLDERLTQFKANPEAGSSWEDVKARLEALD